MRRVQIFTVVALVGCSSDAPGMVGATGMDDVTSSPGGSTAASSSGTSADVSTTEPEPGSSGEASTGTPTGDDPPVRFDFGGLPDTPNTSEPCIQNVDIVFVMDVSTTMGSFLGSLADEVIAVDQALAALDLPEAPHYGLAVFVDDALMLNDGMPYADAAALQADFQYWSAFTSTNQQVGGGNSNATWPENSLDALYFAATQFDWRPAEDTTRLIIHTTDDTFWEGPSTQNGVTIENDYPGTIAALQEETIRVFAFADTIGGACGCLDVSMGWFGDYEGTPSIPESTDGGVYDINQILNGSVSLADAITASVEESYCEDYNPVG